MPSPQDELCRLLFSPVPTQTRLASVGRDGDVADRDSTPGASKTGSNVVPMFTVFQRPPVALADVEDGGIALQHREIIDAAARRGRSDVAELEAVEWGLGEERSQEQEHVGSSVSRFVGGGSGGGIVHPRPTAAQQGVIPSAGEDLVVISRPRGAPYGIEIRRFLAPLGMTLPLAFGPEGQSSKAGAIRVDDVDSISSRSLLPRSTICRSPGDQLGWAQTTRSWVSRVTPDPSASIR